MERYLGLGRQDLPGEPHLSQMRERCTSAAGSEKGAEDHGTRLDSAGQGAPGHWELNKVGEYFCPLRSYCPKLRMRIDWEAVPGGREGSGAVFTALLLGTGGGWPRITLR